MDVDGCRIGGRKVIDLASLAALRRRAYLSQQELADRAGVSKASVFKLEAGTVRRPHGRTVRAIAAALGVDPLDVDEFRAAVERER